MAKYVQNYSAKLSSAFENDKIIVYMPKKSFTRGNEHKSADKLKLINNTVKCHMEALQNSPQQFKCSLERAFGISGKVDVNGGIFKLCTREKACNSSGIQGLL